jgi:hypothetical protein
MERKSKNELGSLLQRISEQTPPFFKKLRTVGLVTIAAGTVLVSAPIAIPAMLVTIGGYLIVGGGVMTAMAQAAVEEN